MNPDGSDLLNLAQNPATSGVRTQMDTALR